jgi:hypothetical protein
MNKGETGQSNGEKTTSAKKNSRLLTPQLRAAACVRSVLEDQAKLLLSVKTAALTSGLITPFRSSLNWTK